MAAFVVSAAAFTVPEAGYVVSAIVFLLQVRARLAARPGRADACRRGAANARGLARGSASASRAHSGLRCAVSGPILQLRPRRGARTIRGRLYLHEIASVPRGPAARGERGCTARARPASGFGGDNAPDAGSKLISCLVCMPGRCSVCGRSCCRRACGYRCGAAEHTHAPALGSAHAPRGCRLR